MIERDTIADIFDTYLHYMLRSNENANTYFLAQYDNDRKAEEVRISKAESDFILEPDDFDEFKSRAEERFDAHVEQGDYALMYQYTVTSNIAPPYKLKRFGGAESCEINISEEEFRYLSTIPEYYIFTKRCDQISQFHFWGVVSDLDMDNKDDQAFIRMLEKVQKSKIRENTEGLIKETKNMIKGYAIVNKETHFCVWSEYFNSRHNKVEGDTNGHIKTFPSLYLAWHTFTNLGLKNDKYEILRLANVSFSPLSDANKEEIDDLELTKGN